MQNTKCSFNLQSDKTGTLSGSKSGRIRVTEAGRFGVEGNPARKQAATG